MNIQEKNKAFDLLYPTFKKDIFTNNLNAINFYLNDENFYHDVNEYKNIVFLLTLTNSPNQNIFLSLLDKKVINSKDLLEVESNTKKNILLNLITKQNLNLLDNIFLTYPNLIKETVLGKSLLSYSYSSYNPEMVNFFEKKFNDYPEFIDLSHCVLKVINYPQSLNFLFNYYIKHKKSIGLENLSKELFSSSNEATFNTIHQYISKHTEILLSPERPNTHSLLAHYVYQCLENNKTNEFEEIFPRLKTEEKELLFREKGYIIKENNFLSQYISDNTRLFHFNNILFSYQIYHKPKNVYDLMKQGVHHLQKKDSYDNTFLSNWFSKNFHYMKNDFDNEMFDKIITEFANDLGDNFISHFLYKYSSFSHLYEEKTGEFIFNKISLYLNHVEPIKVKPQLNKAVSDWIDEYQGVSPYNDDQAYEYEFLDYVASKILNYEDENPFYHFSNFIKKISKHGDIELFKIISKYNPDFKFEKLSQEKSFNILNSTSNKALKDIIQIYKEKQKLETQFIPELTQIKKKMKL